MVSVCLPRTLHRSREVYFGVIAQIQTLSVSGDAGVVPDDGVVQHRFANARIITDDAVAQDRRVDARVVADGHVRSDDAVGNVAARTDVNRMDDDGIVERRQRRVRNCPRLTV